jgi:hypothetical protein
MSVYRGPRLPSGLFLVTCHPVQLSGILSVLSLVYLLHFRILYPFRKTTLRSLLFYLTVNDNTLISHCNL